MRKKAFSVHQQDTYYLEMMDNKRRKSKTIFEILDMNDMQADATFKKRLKEQFVQASRPKRSFVIAISTFFSFQMSFAIPVVLLVIISMLFYPLVVRRIDPDAMLGQVYAGTSQASLVPVMNAITHMYTHYEDIPTHDYILQPLDLRLMTLDASQKQYDSIKTIMTIKRGPAATSCATYYAFDTINRIETYEFIDGDEYSFYTTETDAQGNVVEEFGMKNNRIHFSRGSIDEWGDSTVALRREQFESPPLSDTTPMVRVGGLARDLMRMSWSYLYDCGEGELHTITSEVFIDEATNTIKKVVVLLDDEQLLYEVDIAFEQIGQEDFPSFLRE